MITGDPPEPEELIKALQDLENSASSDAVVRERIANFPPEVSEVSLLTKLGDKEQATKLAAQVSGFPWPVDKTKCFIYKKKSNIDCRLEKQPVYYTSTMHG